MVTKILKTEQGLAVLIPPETLEQLGLAFDAEVNVTLNQELSQIVITPASLSLPGIDETFAQQVSEFIEQYRPALEALAK
jgi:antitoxin component of MazEF toxin-antitoxin module